MSDTNKIVDYLFEIGFTWEEIKEFYERKPDFVDNKGQEHYGPDCLYAIVQEDDETVEIEYGDFIETYWEKGWISDFVHFRRRNYDSYNSNYYKVFPTRYKLFQFKFTKSLRRVLNKNRDLRSVIRPLRITPAKSNLRDTHHFLRYGKPPEKPLTESYKYITHHPAKLMELCIFKEDRLVACSIFEVGNFAIYSNVGFWDVTEKSRSLGTLTVLLEIKYALEKKFYYYYLGHFYAQNPLYHYKTRFPTLELYDWESESWVDFNYKPKIKEMLKQKLPRHQD